MTTNSNNNVPCWLVWQRADDGGRPYLVAVDTTETKAQAHVRAIKDAARMENKVVMVQIEKSWLDHLYGESMGQGYDKLKEMFMEIKRRKKVEGD
jgi:hypothetical protein